MLPNTSSKPLVSTASIQVYIIPAEKNLYVDGFLALEYENRPPTLLRGCLYLRVLKPAKIKSINLHFKGIQRTDWPEGIPPKKVNYAEVNDVVSHTWPFYQSGNQFQGLHGGADHFQELPNRSLNGTPVNEDITHLSLAETQTRSLSPRPRSNTSNSQSTVTTTGGGLGDFFARTISLSPAAGLLRKTANSSDNNTTSSLRDLSASPSLTDLSTVLTDNPNVGQFNPGDYIYNFEHPLPPSTPETCKMTFGEVSYHLEAIVARPGTFKLNLQCRLPINVVRIPSEDNLEENEPIVITRDWEDQLKYDIVIGSKSVVLNSYLLLAFRFVPLFGKVALHRIRVYLTENLEYYCNNKKVHRMEPQKKYLLLEHKALKGKSLLSKSGGLVEGEDVPDCGDDDEEVLPRELEFQVFVPETLSHERSGLLKIHADTSFENIKSHHWIKICLRISRFDPEKPDKRKHFEIRIDSPINILSAQCVHANTLLPAYDPDDFAAFPVNSPPTSPGVTPVTGMLNMGGSNQTSLDAMMEDNPRHFLNERYGLPSRSRSPSVREFQHITTERNNDSPIERDHDMHLEANIYKPDEGEETNLNSPQAMPFESPVGSPIISPIPRPIHLLRRPSFNPPAFEEATSNPLMFINPPPDYDSLDRVIEDEEEHYNTTEEQLHDAPEYVERGRRRTNTDITNASSSSQTETLDLAQEESTSGNANGESTTSNELNINIRPPSPHNEGISPIENDLSVQLPPSPSKHITFNANLSPKVTPSISNTTSPRLGARSRSSDSMSRKSSVSSLPSFVSPIERTPLLNDSTASIDGNQYGTGKSRNSSIISLLQSGALNSGSVNNGKKQSFGIVDLNDDIFKINGNLLQLRNPRIKKHYQDDEIEEGGEAEVTDDNVAKVRQKSFGVVDSRINKFRDNPTQNSSESDETSNEDRTENSTYEPIKEETPREVAGLNLSYNIIE